MEQYRRFFRSVRVDYSYELTTPVSGQLMMFSAFAFFIKALT